MVMCACSKCARHTRNWQMCKFTHVGAKGFRGEGGSTSAAGSWAASEGTRMCVRRSHCVVGLMSLCAESGCGVTDMIYGSRMDSRREEASGSLQSCCRHQSGSHWVSAVRRPLGLDHGSRLTAVSWGLNATPALARSGSCFEGTKQCSQKSFCSFAHILWGWWHERLLHLDQFPWDQANCQNIRFKLVLFFFGSGAFCIDIDICLTVFFCLSPAILLKVR